MKPTDTLFSSQWHLSRLGNIQRIWDEFSGRGVHVGVYDDGVQSSHQDLKANYDPRLHVTYGGVTYDGEPITFEEAGHGTSAAGLIAASRNGVGTVGVAWGTSLTGVNVFDWNSPLDINGPEADGFYAAIAQASKFDVVSNSWGSGHPEFMTVQNVRIAGSFAAETLTGWKAAAANGRDGLGTVIVKAAGNDDGNSNGDGLDASRFTVTVAAVRADGFSSSYSNYGANVLVAAPGGDDVPEGAPAIVTTDLQGTRGYNMHARPEGPSDFTDQFGGTSSAAPIVSGVVALMLDAAPALGWRDVQNILAVSATHTGSRIGGPIGSYEDRPWFINGAENWNGGGMHFSENYGYGMVNAHDAVRMAEAWHLLTPTPQTSANELVRTSGQVTANLTLPEMGTRTFKFAVSAGMELDFAALTMSVRHEGFSDLRIHLVSPEGTEVMLKDTIYETSQNSNPAASGLSWTFGAEAFRGEDPTGTWTIRFEDKLSGLGGVVNWIDLDLHGRAAGSNDAYHFTDAFGPMVALTDGSGRRVLSDADGGSDWINASALSRRAVIDLDPGATSTLGGGSFKITAGTAIEHAVAGDGNDALTGNSHANRLYGMRGDDVLVGGGGNDTLVGGAGSDTASYTTAQLSLTISLANGTTRVTGHAVTDRLTGIENLIGGSGGDVLGGSSLANRLQGGAGNDRLDGAGGNDRLEGGSGADTLTGRSGQDVLLGGTGADLFDFDALTDSLVGAGRDLVLDFSRSEGDHIDLRGIDAASGRSGDQSFIFLADKPFGGTAGQLHYTNISAGLLLGGDVTGDGVSDFQVEFRTSLGAFVAGDFLL